MTLVFLSIFAAGLTDRAFATDARKGEILAKRWCNTCDVVSSDQPQGTSALPLKADIMETKNGIRPVSDSTLIGQIPEPKSERAGSDLSSSRRMGLGKRKACHALNAQPNRNN